ncbi:hypothetical protein HY571_01915 [Candidatus Micrarchaeota archaeon]|nr:hypothetical protein [Candidatus Micrarchaeota archaeon]
MPRTHEEMENFLCKPQNLETMRRAIAVRKFGGKPKNIKDKKHDERVNRLILKAVFGQRVFRGASGRHFKAISEERKEYGLHGEKLKKFGHTLFNGMNSFKWAVWSLPPEMLAGLNDTQKLDLVHYLKRSVENMLMRGEYMRKFGRWKPTRRF